MQVREVMNPSPPTCTSDTDLASLSVSMASRHCEAVVVTTHDGRWLGLVTERDVHRATTSSTRPAYALVARDIQHWIFYACRPEDDLRSALRLMQAHHLSHLPVVGRGETPAGLVSIWYLARKAEEARRAHSTEFPFDEVESVKESLAHRSAEQN